MCVCVCPDIITKEIKFKKRQIAIDTKLKILTLLTRAFLIIPHAQPCAMEGDQIQRQIAIDTKLRILTFANSVFNCVLTSAIVIASVIEAGKMA